MERVNKIVQHPLYRESMEIIRAAEEGRLFCKHDFAHFFDVARLAYIYCLEKSAGISKEIIYSAAMLHDIGRRLQYTKRIPHHQAGRELAEKILPDCGFSKEEQQTIMEAVLCHRQEEIKKEDSLSGFLYRADKASRLCFDCPAREGCNWPEEKMNLEIDY